MSSIKNSLTSNAVFHQGKVYVQNSRHVVNILLVDFGALLVFVLVVTTPVTTQPQQCSCVGHENDCANLTHPPTPQKLNGGP